MSHKLYNLGTKVSPNSVVEHRGNFYMTIPNAVGRRGLFTVAVDWCGHCKQLAENIKEARIVNPFPSYYVVGDENPASKRLTQRLGIEGFPSMFIIERDGRLTPYNGSRLPQAINTAIRSNSW